MCLSAANTMSFEGSAPTVTEHARRKEDTQIRIPLPVPQSGVCSGRNDVRGSLVVLRETKHVL